MEKEKMNNEKHIINHVMYVCIYLTSKTPRTIEHEGFWAVARAALRIIVAS